MKLEPIDKNITSTIEFRHTTAEQLEQDGHKFDIVCGLEIIEHVENPREFVKMCSNLTKLSLVDSTLICFKCGHQTIHFSGYIMPISIEFGPNGKQDSMKLQKHTVTQNATVTNC